MLRLALYMMESKTNVVRNVAISVRQFWEVPVATFEDKRMREGFTFLTFFLHV